MVARQVPLSEDFYGPVAENPDNVLTIGEKFSRLEDAQNLPELYIDVRNRMRQAYEKNKGIYNLRKRHITFDVGEKVWKKNYTLSNAANCFSSKLAPKCIPAVVSKVICNLVYELQDIEGKNLGNWHVKDIKPDLCPGEDDSDEDEASG